MAATSATAGRASAATGGRTLGGFTVEREIGRGGMGEVLLATQTSLGRAVVLKRILRDLAGEPELAARFEREARAAGALHHGNVVAVYDLFTHRGAQYIALEYVDGVDLASAIALEGALPWRVAATIALEMARGLEAVHARGTLHRDLKPANLLLGRRGEVKITDFGLALDAEASPLTRPGVALGTPSYMAPEQLRCERADARSDVFAFGCVLYEMLTGAPAFPPAACDGASGGGARGTDDGAGVGAARPASDSAALRIQRGRYVPVRRAARGVPRRLARLVARCLRPSPKRRVASARELRRALEQLLASPASADCQAELARFLRERNVIEPRSDETLVLVAAEPRAPARRPLRALAAAVVLALATAALAGALARPLVVAGYTDRARAAFADVRARAAARSHLVARAAPRETGDAARASAARAPGGSAPRIEAQASGGAPLAVEARAPSGEAVTVEARSPGES